MISDAGSPGWKQAWRKTEDDSSAFFRGVAIAVALSLPIWGGAIWALTRLG